MALRAPSSNRAFVVAALHAMAACIAAAGSVAPAARVPPLGINTWYAFGMAASFERTTEGNIMAAAEYMVRSGLRDAGYDVIVIDDGWSSGTRGADGGLEANTTKFPCGMASLTRRLRAMGLKVGLYTTPGDYTCAGQSGGRERASKGHEAEDIARWVGEWGVAWVKNCVCNSTQAERRESYHKMRNALSNISSQAVLECANYMDAPWQRDEVTGRVSASDCDVYTVSDDVEDSFGGWNLIVDLAEAQGARQVEGAGRNPPIWPSYDYVRVGGSQSLEEYRAQVSFMAIAPAPLVIGSELDLAGETAMLPESVLALYKAPGMLAVHQDALAARGRRVRHDAAGRNGHFLDVWARPLSGGRTAVLLLNRGGKNATFDLDLAEILPSTSAAGGAWDDWHGTATDAWTGRATALRGRRPQWAVGGSSGALLVIAERAAAAASVVQI